MASLRVCLVGLHPSEHNYSRHYVIKEGLRRVGIEVEVIPLPTWVDVLECLTDPSRAMGLIPRQILQLMNHFPKLASCDVILVPAFKQLLAPFIWFIGKALDKPILLDYLVGLTDINDDRKLLSSNIVANIYRWVDSFNITHMITIADTTAHCEFYHQLLKVEIDKMQVVPVGVRDPLVHLQFPPLRPDEEIVVQYFGIYIPFHGVDVILRAANILRNDTRIRFELVGTGQTYSAATKLAKKLRLQNVAFFPTYFELPEYLEMISRSSVLLGVFGDRNKTKYVIPNKVYEGMAAGRPVITAQSPAISEFFEPGEHLVTIPSNDPEQLAAAINSLSVSPTDCKRIGEAARKRIRETFLPQHIGEQMKEIITTMLKG